MIIHQHDYRPTHPMRPGYYQNAIDWLEKAWARVNAMGDGETDCTIAIQAALLLEAHKAAMYDRWMRQLYADDCACVLPEQSCPVCAPAQPEDASIPF